MRIRALAQARLKSERLPRKVLMPIGGKALLQHIAVRLQTLEGMGVELVFAIAEENSAHAAPGGDITLADFLTQAGLSFHTGHSTNVLRRFTDAAADLAATDYVVRLTADNPFPDMKQLAQLITHAKEKTFDYGYTADLPLGMGTELIRVAALRSVAFRETPTTAGGENGLKDHHREHVTTFIRENPHLYDIYPLRLDDTLSDEAAKKRVSGIRLTVDEEADLIVAQRVFEYFERRGMPNFTALDVIQLKRNFPELLAGNEHIAQRPATSSDSRLR